jgi:hypothetical protein
MRFRSAWLQLALRVVPLRALGSSFVVDLHGRRFSTSSTSALCSPPQISAITLDRQPTRKVGDRKQARFNEGGQIVFPDVLETTCNEGDDNGSRNGGRIGIHIGSRDLWCGRVEGDCVRMANPC